MKRATVTLLADLESVVEEFMADQAVRPNFTALIQSALREYLAGQGYPRKERSFLDLPVHPVGSGFSDTSVNHDEILGEAIDERKLVAR